MDIFKLLKKIKIQKIRHSIVIFLNNFSPIWTNKILNTINMASITSFVNQLDNPSNLVIINNLRSI